MRIAAWALIILFLGPDAFGRANLDFSIHQQFIAPRSVGMGGTFSGMDDYNTLFYNPAGLARLEEGQINLGLQAGVTLDPNFLDLTSEIDDAGDDYEALADALTDAQGNVYHLRGPTINAIWARPGWGIGIIPADVTLNVTVEQLGLGVKAINDTTLAFGYAHHFNKKTKDTGLSVGATARANYRATGDLNYSYFDVVQSDDLVSEEDLKEGLLLDFDVGTIWSPMIPKKGAFSWLRFARPHFHFVVRNVLDDVGDMGNLHLLSEDSDEDEGPETPQRRFDLGTRWDLPTWWVFTPRIMVDIRDMGHRYWTLTKGSHLGAELDWKLSSWFNGAWRAGLNQGYYTLGATFHALWFRADLATYGEEIGTTDAPKENRVYMAKLSLLF